MNFIEDFKARGYFYQCTNLDELKSLTATKKIAAYIGFDCTANSLHVGNLMQIMILRLLQRHGHKPVIIVGGATTKIGDPSGKDEARKMLDDEQLEENKAGLKKSLSKFIKFGSGKSDAVMLDNSSWLEKLNYIEFLRDYGKLFSVNRMLTMDSVKLRLERQQPLTFLEFNYMLLQAYDFYHLYREYNCMLQIGGSDQWGNIVMGTELIRRLTGNEAYGLTTPLLTTSSGAKMGKSVSGAVWLNEDMLSPYDYYQYWRNCEDLDVVRFAKIYAEFDEKETTEFIHLGENDINAAKKRLAFRLTELCHGTEAAQRALDTATALFEQGGVDENMPTFFMEESNLKTGIAVYELLFLSGLTDSKSASRRLIRSGAVKVNDEKIDDENLSIDMSMLREGALKLSAGKKKHVSVRVK